MVRAGATGFGIDPDRVGVLRFSAAGHLAGLIATRFDERVHAPIDAADRLSARPDLAALLYPSVSMVAPARTAARATCCWGRARRHARADASVERRVAAATPPLSLIHAGDDGLVPVANSVALYTAMQARSRPAE